MRVQITEVTGSRDPDTGLRLTTACMRTAPIANVQRQTWEALHKKNDAHLNFYYPPV